MLDQAGVDSRHYRGAPLARRVNACLRRLRVSTEESARARLTAQPDLLAPALSTLLIGVSAFFRDSGVWNAVRSIVIPSVLQRSRRPRVWSAGCSTGAELYSMAMMLDEAGAITGADLLGTDCRTDAVADARLGHFADTLMDGVDAARRQRHFDRRPLQWEIHGRHRAATRWRVRDATTHVENGPWDVILCRNVVIYLQSDKGTAMFTDMAARLRPGGFLIVGRAERPPTNLGLTAVAPCVYRAHG